ncbi:NAD-dependent epimerase/dehydratase family protein [Caulobacter rhizosphaerae]|jgi:nucleoside-diphosphate-sugar epimerase|uniref:NAD-dependent epimerase/dehydratase family protein n=1 Tax=Caulobacter rhizosphaerae TaxID=2010972 RepID=UPI0013D8218F|nr:NAD(P)-dependent oxidoreductase [Caulobacter rhizosphaerae]GGL38046.1 epimerase [Caulobacter rhizosphaerae]
MKRALVIGSEGNIGKPLAAHLRAEGWEVLCADIKPGWRKDYLQVDINQPADLMPTLRWKPDVIFALAAVVSRVTCEQASSLAVSTNLGGLNNVILLAQAADAKLVYFSTSEVYGPTDGPMDEIATVPRPNNRYGLTKLLGEQLVDYEVAQHGLRAVTLRPFMIYDENEDFGDHRSAMIRFAHDLARGLPIEVHRGGARGWLHISDAVLAIEAAAGVDEHAVINIGHPDITPIEALAEGLRTRLDAAPSLITLRDLPARMTAAKQPALDRMRDLLGVSPKVSLDEGLDRVVARVRARLAQGRLEQPA